MQNSPYSANTVIKSSDQSNHVLNPSASIEGNVAGLLRALISSDRFDSFLPLITVLGIALNTEEKLGNLNSGSCGESSIVLSIFVMAEFANLES